MPSLFYWPSPSRCSRTELARSFGSSDRDPSTVTDLDTPNPASKWRRITLAIGLPFLAAALLFAFRDINALVLPHWFRWVLATPLLAAFVIFTQRSWSVFLPAGGTPRDRLAFYESQLVKYSPLGGVAQTASQVLTLPGEREERSRIVRKVLVSKLAAACGGCLLYTSPSPRDRTRSRMPSSA